MKAQQFRRITAGLLILGAVVVNVPYTLLMMNFDYPDILREPAGEILTRFAAGGPGLIWTWLAFAWVGLPILLGILRLPRALAGGDASSPGRATGEMAMFFGAAGAVAQIIGLLRWPFVVPSLARLYTSTEATPVTREAVVAVFQAVHQYGGVVLGEHIGQTFTILWMILLSVSLLQQRKVSRWLPLAGFAAAGVYALAQGELLATAIPGFPVLAPAGLVGSLMWLGWLVALGIELMRMTRSSVYGHTGQDPQLSAGAVQ
jgi:hypothetical protein